MAPDRTPEQAPTVQGNDRPFGKAAEGGTPPDSAPLPSDGVQFMHESEQQFARLLDFYRVRWQYEPTTFVFSRDDLGNPTEAFSPDFYLPDEDVYIEITTMNQNLIRRKNRKLRRLHECYPDVTCKLFNQRDFGELLLKYGLVASDGTEPAERGAAE